MSRSSCPASRFPRFYLAAAMMLTIGTGAHAFEFEDRSFVLRHGSTADLQIYDTRQRRDAYQQGQARFRDEDSGLAKRPPRLKIPRLARKCLPPVGRNMLGTCR